MLWAWGLVACTWKQCVHGVRVNVHGVSIHEVWSECAQRESAPSVGEGTGCVVIVHGLVECVWGKGECAQHA